VRSELDDVPGIGEARKKALLRHFGSLAKVKEATADELAGVKGMTKKTAEEVVNFFQGAVVQGPGPS
jgi:excinuclease ABC subunit C